MLVAYGAVCSDDMTTVCSEDNDCTAPATCVLKPTDRQGYLTEPEPMHTYWPFGYNRTTHAWTYGYCPLAAGSSNKCFCETDATGVGYFEDCDALYPSSLSWMTTDAAKVNGDMKMVPLTRQNVTVASKATKVTLRLCRGECHNDKNLGHIDDAGDRKKGDKESADASNAIVAAEKPPAGSSIASFANEFESEAKAAQAAAAAAAAEAAAAAAPAPEI